MPLGGAPAGIRVGETQPLASRSLKETKASSHPGPADPGVREQTALKPGSLRAVVSLCKLQQVTGSWDQKQSQRNALLPPG